MSITLTPSDALSPEAFYSLYLGGLADDDESVRVETSYVLLALGRLGLAPDEVLHLHDGWLDWERGTLHVPEHDPCGCGECWEEARLRQRQGDSRNRATIVATECWSPSRETTPRRLAFGWSNRLSAAIDAATEPGIHHEGTHATIRERIEAAAANARHLDPQDVSVAALRASAVVFLARAGFGPRRLADLTGISEETAGEFARVGGGEVRNHLYRALAPESSPSLGGEDPDYRLVCDPEGFSREPFDPAEYDADWRAERATRTTPRDRNPRPLSPPPDVEFDADDLPTPGEPTGEGGPAQVAASLAEWVRQREQERTTDEGDSGSPERAVGNGGTTTQSSTTETATADDSTADSDTAEQRETTNTADESGEEPEITAPREFSVDTRLVAPNFENGRPTGGSIILGQEELVFLSRGAEGISDTLRVELDWVANLAPGYVPDPLEGIFEETVGIAYRDKDDERRVVVVEIPEDIRWQFVQTIFAQILTDEKGVVTHRPDEPTAIGPEERTIEAETDSLSIVPDDESDQTVRLRLLSLLDIEEGRMTGEEGYEYGLKIHHIDRTGDPITTEVRPEDDMTKDILKRYLNHYDNKYTNRVRTVTLRDNEVDILKSLYESNGGRNVTQMLDKNPDELSAALKRLGELNLVVSSSGGKRLTGVGYRVVSPEYDL